MPEINNFYLWFYYGLGNLGGWFLFFLTAVSALIWLFYDSYKRRLPAQAWRFGISLAALLILPAGLYRFTVQDVSDVATTPLGSFGEPIFYLGVLGGVLPLVIAIGYYITFYGLAVCSMGHLYKTTQEKCPHPDHLPLPDLHPVIPEPKLSENDDVISPLPRSKRRVNAWLINLKTRKNYQMFADETRIGRSMKNDIVLEGDVTVSREAVFVKEQMGRFKLHTVTPNKFLRVNSYKVRAPLLLEADDEIQLGEDTILKFITSR